MSRFQFRNSPRGGYVVFRRGVDQAIGTVAKVEHWHRREKIVTGWMAYHEGARVSPTREPTRDRAAQVLWDWYTTARNSR